MKGIQIKLKMTIRLILLIPVFIVGVLFVSSCTQKNKMQDLSKVKDVVTPIINDTAYFHPPFQLRNPNWEVSPYTGMTRDHWIQAGVHILEGVFQYVDSLEQPMFLPKFPGKSYPYNGNARATNNHRSSAIFEAMARTFNVAAPLIANNPEITINKIKLKDYYRFHFLQLLTNPESDYYIGDKPIKRPSQQTCELGNLALWNLLLPDSFWTDLTQKEKDQVAKRMTAWAESHTYSHNWRYFNVMMLTFLHHNGYKIDKELMNAHIDNLIFHYSGEGWYRDLGYDYYTMHVFHVYNVVWIEKYGRKIEPERALFMEQQLQEFSENYPLIFGREGTINMYGRSILYRLGASAAMPALQMNGTREAISPGLARRVTSGALLQFISHPDFFNQGIPSLGFYGPFDEAMQPYSCSASPYWMFGSFTGLIFPEDHPFWTATEEMGHWGMIESNEVLNVFQSGPGFLVSNHGSSGVSEIRTSKIYKKGDPNYTKMVYNSAFPWEASAGDGIVSSVLTLRMPGLDSLAQMPVATDFIDYRGGVFYRQSTYKKETYPLPVLLDMASIVIPGGEIRIERIRKSWETELYLGHFSMPNFNMEPQREELEIDGKKAIKLGIPGRQLAMTNILGWDNVETITRTGIHPEAEESTLLYTKYSDVVHKYGPVELLISVLLHKTDDTPWTVDELQPVAKIEPLKKGWPLHLGGMTLSLKNGKTFVVDFKNIDGKSTRH